MNDVMKNKLKIGLKIAFVTFVLAVILKEFKNVIADFDVDIFRMYADRLSLTNMIIIVFLGIISYLPLSFYDFILKKRAGINLDNKKLYKFSWIASSISSVLGFGGTTSIALKSHFYKDYINDNKVLIKEISRIVALNLSGFSMVCFIYFILNITDLLPLNVTKVLTTIIGMYLPILTTYLLYKYKNNGDRDEIKDTFKIILISLSEWVTTIVLIYSIVYILGANVSFIKFFPIFVAAIVVAMLSMSPGGIGTFDLTLLLGLEALGIRSELVLLAIFLYRLTYYIIPVMIGLILYATELWNKVDEDLRCILGSILSNVAHWCLVVLVFLAGVMLLVSEAMPGVINRIYWIDKIFNRSIIYISGDLSVIVGFLLIAISMVITYKSKSVYKISMILVILSFIFTSLRGFNHETAIYLVVVGIALRMSKNKFYRESFITRWGRLIFDFVVLLAFQILYLGISYMNLSGKIDKLPVMLRPEIHYSYYYAIKLIVISSIGLLTALLFLAVLSKFNKKNKFPKITLDKCEDKVEEILYKYGGTSVSHFIYLRDKFIYINKDGDVLLQYQIYANKVAVLGNPVGDKNKFFDIIQEFYDLSDKYGYTPVFCAIDKNMIPYLHETGYQFMKLGEEARVKLDTFTLEGRKMKSVRNAISRVEKEKYTFDIIKPPFSNEFISEIRKVSNEWLGNRKEKGFSIGFFDEEYLSRADIAIVRNKNNEIKGFTNIMPMYDGNKTLSIDLMRFSHDTCNGIMDYMFVNLFKWGRENGYIRFNMGMAPLANVGTSKYSFTSEKIASQVYLHGQYFYSFKGLKNFKQKYAEIWDGRYIAYKRKTSLVFTMIQVILLVSNAKPYKKSKSLVNGISEITI